MSKFAIELNRDRRRAEGNTCGWSFVACNTAMGQTPAAQICEIGAEDPLE